MNAPANENVGQVATCSRCGELCKVAPEKNPEARMLRASATPRGHCANCAVSEWFVLHEEIARIGDLPAALLIKPVQDQFAKVMISAGADMKPAEINWEKVVEHWALPFPEHARKKRGRRPR